MTNNNEISVKELFELIKSISKYVEREVKFYALGGTALTILNLKKSTKDVDINIETENDYRYICKIFDELGFERNGIRWITQEGLAFDMFHSSNIMGTGLRPDCISKSKFIDSFGNIKLYTLSLDDIIISKLARGDSRDFDDIKVILEHSEIDLKNLVQRYKETMETSIVANYKQKLLDLIEIKLMEWKFKIDDKMISEVKKWEGQ